MILVYLRFFLVSDLTCDIGVFTFFLVSDLTCDIGVFTFFSCFRFDL